MLLAELRERSGDPSLRDLSRLTGVSVSTISRIFSGKSVPTRHVMESLANGLDTRGGELKALYGAWQKALYSNFKSQSSQSAKSASPERQPSFLPVATDDYGVIRPDWFDGSRWKTGELTGGPVAASLILGAMLRELRVARGMSALSAAERMGFSVSRLSRIERALAPIELQDALLLAKLYGASGDVVNEVRNLVEQASAPGWWEDFRQAVPAEMSLLLSLESAASRLQSYDSLSIPAILRAEAYSLAVQKLGLQSGKTEAKDSLDLQAARQKRYFDSSVRSLFILDESLLHRTLGGPRAMAEQMERLIQVTALPGHEIRILPYRAAVFLSVGSVTHLEFLRGIPAITVIESSYLMKYFHSGESSDGVGKLLLSLREVVAQAESHSVSLDMLRSAKVRFERDRIS
ncbi:Scr1 family TA system antitoxin-like transcriptional regulator [Streptomyces anulatus]|uniref:Scr1 family TA system antitoxin-like transcriptional regulator n=1 Tax=Streptomyces anulatus TaxID=1892 RepID=UPI0033FEFFD6